MNRLLSITLRFAAVAILGNGVVATRTVHAEDAAADLTVALRKAASPSSTPEQRAAVVERLAKVGELPDPDAVARVAFRAYLDARSGSAAADVTLLRHALEAGGVSEETLGTVRAWVDRTAAALDSSTGGPPGAAAVAVLTGRRSAFLPLVGKFWGAPATLDALAYDAPELSPKDLESGSPDEATWARHVAAADLMDAALSDDPKVARPALDALLASAKKGDAMPYLLAVAARRPKNPPGLTARRARAILVLGMAGDSRARPVLEAALMDNVDSHDEGWARVAAATALGDLGDPAAIPALCHVLFYLGDVARVPDAWDYPGKGNTDVPEEAWPDAEYYALDCATADTLLRLGVANAAEWLIRERLALGATRWRIRVLYDAADAVRRAFPAAPKGYVPDGGLPDRDRAAKALLAWWKTGPRLEKPLDETDAGFTTAARALVGRLGEKGVMELQIAKKAAALIGPAMTPTLLEGLAASKKKVQRAEIAAVLGTVRDRRAVAPLLALTNDDVANVRAVAAESLTSYLETGSDPLFSNETKTTPDAIVARWIAMLDDEDEGPRASAMRALASAPPRADVLAATKAHASATHPENAFGDFALAEGVALLVQTGEGLEEIAKGLADPVLFRRRTLWELLLRALPALDPATFDPTPDPVPAGPGQPAAKPVDLAALRAALSKRRGA